MPKQKTPEKFEPLQELRIKPSDLKIKIIGLIPAGADPLHPFNRYNLDIEGHKIVVKEDLLRLLFTGENNET